MLICIIYIYIYIYILVIVVVVVVDMLIPQKQQECTSSYALKIYTNIYKLLLLLLLLLLLVCVSDTNFEIEFLIKDDIMIV